MLVISLGAAGALAVSRNFAEHILPPTVPIISKVGAGDIMVSDFEDFFFIEELRSSEEQSP